MRGAQAKVHSYVLGCMGERMGDSWDRACQGGQCERGVMSLPGLKGVRFSCPLATALRTLRGAPAMVPAPTTQGFARPHKSSQH